MNLESTESYSQIPIPIIMFVQVTILTFSDLDIHNDILDQQINFFYVAI